MTFVSALRINRLLRKMQAFPGSLRRCGSGLLPMPSGVKRSNRSLILRRSNGQAISQLIDDKRL